MNRVLVVDDEPGLRQSLGLLLADAGYDVVAEASGARALQRARAEPFDLILCDVRMADMDGIAFLRAYKSGGGPALVIMMSAYGGEEAALAAMKEGAYDYVAKPFRPDEVVLTLRKAEERERLGHTIATLRAQLDSSPAARVLVAESPAMKQALETVARVAEHPTTVLITGERGTGKEVIAQAIHRASPRAAGPFVAVNCAAIPDTLLESELFGYVKGAFTGRRGTARGCSSRPTAVRCCWTRSASCRSGSRRSCCACCRRMRSAAWGTRRRGTWMSDCSRRPLRTSPRRPRRGGSDPICSTGLTSWRFTCGRCPSGVPTSHPSRGILQPGWPA